MRIAAIGVASVAALACLLLPGCGGKEDPKPEPESQDKGGRSEAQRLFERMKEMVLKARSVHLEWKGSLPQGTDRTLDVRGDIRLERKNRVRIQVQLLEKVLVEELFGVSDGDRWYSKHHSDKDIRRGNVPTSLDRGVRLYLISFGGMAAAGQGTLGGSLTKGNPTPAEIEASISVDKFRMEATEIVAGRSANVIQYEAIMGQEKVTLEIRLWLDAETHLPLRRRIVRIRRGKRQPTGQEDYALFKLDVKVADSQFKVP